MAPSHNSGHIVPLRW